MLLLFFCAGMIHKFYPLFGEKWRGIKAGLAAQHAQKQKAYEQEVLMQETNR